jgi:hypothetical protein
MTRIAFITDVEGQWDKLATFAANNPLVRLETGDRLELAEGAALVFGGDTIDRGPDDRRVLRALVGAKRRAPDRVTLIAGNRDLNKLRLVRELAGSPPAGAPAEVLTDRGALLRWIFRHTMGAKDAFEHRRNALGRAGADASDDAVVQSYLDDLAEGGALFEYLAHAQLAHRIDETLFVHGAVGPGSLGHVPGEGARIDDVDRWIARLNRFYAEQIDAFATRALAPDGQPGWTPIVEYQGPVKGRRDNPGSVIYARSTDPHNNPFLPDAEVVRELGRAGIARVVVGHTPSGDCPSLLRHDGFELVMADNSYGRHERGAQVLLDGRLTEFRGETVLDSGEREPIAVTLALDEETPIGRRDANDGHLVKSRLQRGDYLMFRAHEQFRVEQRAEPPEAITARRLVPPFAPIIEP